MIPKQMQNDAEKPKFCDTPHKEDIYQEFIRWSAMIRFDKIGTGMVDQNDFAAHYKISKDTLSRWKNRPDFYPALKEIRTKWGQEKMPDIMESVYRSAVRGNTASIKLWLDYFTEYDRGGKKHKQIVKEPVFDLEDIRFTISMLPKFRQNRYYLFLDQLKYDSKFFSDLADQGKTITEEEYNEKHDFGGL
jgi:hypothetical protein